MQKKASQAPSKSDDDDDEIQVISEKTTNPKPNQTVLQLGLPKVSKFFILVSKELTRSRVSIKSVLESDTHNTVQHL